MTQPGLADIEKLLQDGDFAPGSALSWAMEAIRRTLVERTRFQLDNDGFIEIQLHNGARVRYEWDKQIGGWQAIL